MSETPSLSRDSSNADKALRIINTTDIIDTHTATCLKGYGYNVVGRTISRDPKNCLTRDEASLILGNTLSLFTVFTDPRNNSAAYFTIEQADKDRAFINDQILQIGQPAASVVFIPVPFNVITGKDATSVLLYLQRLVPLCQAHYVGIYGSGLTLNIAQNVSSGLLFWLAHDKSWSGYVDYYRSKQWVMAQQSYGSTCIPGSNDSEINPDGLELHDFKALRKEFLAGGWSMNLKAHTPKWFDFVMFGMITDLKKLKSQGSKPWSPMTKRPPDTPSGTKAMWTYGGQNCAPKNRPTGLTDIQKISFTTQAKGWEGIDIDDECYMDPSNLVGLVQFFPKGASSYSFLAGDNYNDPSTPDGRHTNAAIQKLSEMQVCYRFNLLCYADAMWDDATIDSVVPKSINLTIKNGVGRKRIFLAVTTAGLNRTNLKKFLDFVVENDLGGLSVWKFENLSHRQITQITERLKL